MLLAASVSSTIRPSVRTANLKTSLPFIMSSALPSLSLIPLKLRERRISSADEPTTVLAEHACRKALEAADVDGGEIDLLVLGTTTPDLIFPSSACLIQKKLGLPDCGAMDVNAACSGFIYAICIADKFIRCGDAKKVLVCGAETLSSLTNWNKRETAVLFW